MFDALLKIMKQSLLDDHSSQLGTINTGQASYCDTGNKPNRLLGFDITEAKNVD